MFYFRYGVYPKNDPHCLSYVSLLNRSSPSTLKARKTHTQWHRDVATEWDDLDGRAGDFKESLHHGGFR